MARCYKEDLRKTLRTAACPRYPEGRTLKIAVYSIQRSPGYRGQAAAHSGKGRVQYVGSAILRKS